ncbi:MAG: alanine racemase [Candidatus Omnitrophica bacterium]|nr:alanine racemase [Candidatus Omnitrophota bacterium]
MSKRDLSLLTWAEIDMAAIRHNIRQIRRIVDQNKFYLPTRKNKPKHAFSHTHILAVIKADAYGHGMEKVALLLDDETVDFFGVSNIFEGMRLRRLGIKKPILLFESTLADHIPCIGDYRFIPTVGSLPIARGLNAYAQRKKRRINIHVKVDTGMGRLGIWHRDAFEFVQSLFKLRHLTIQGIYTHFPVADTDRSFTQMQIQQLCDLVTRLDQKGMVIPFIHGANSMGLVGYQTHVLNLVRPGLMIYGLYPDPRLSAKIKLKPAMTVRSRIIFIKTIKKGHGVSYGHTFKAKEDIPVAIISIGYSDGYFRCLSNKADVLVKGVRCPVIGNVTMNQIIIDLSAVQLKYKRTLKVGTPVTILGKDKTGVITADELAAHARTINYEIICQLGNRIKRLYKNIPPPSDFLNTLLALDNFTA